MGFSNLAYLVGALRDGTVHYDKASRNYCVIWYEDNPRWLLNSIATRVHAEFGKNPRLQEYKPTHYRVIMYSKAAFNLFKNDFGFVCPQTEWGTPNAIRNAEDDAVAKYVAGFFDAEGDVSTTNYVAGFSQKNLESLSFIRTWLIGRDVSCSKIFCADKKSGTNRFYFTHKKNFQKFRRLVPFEHPDKILKLEILLH
ncbi:MAG: hypothetical protein V1817_04510 [Candidatus Micrarchaeota archaeon]